METRRGTLEAILRADREVAEGSVFMPFCFAESPANRLTNPKLDPVGKIPEFKYCAARVDRVRPTVREAAMESGGYEVAVRLIGLAGWSGSGKTTLLAKLLPVLIARGNTSRRSSMRTTTSTSTNRARTLTDIAWPAPARCSCRAPDVGR